MSRKRKRWSYTAGRRPHSVTVEEFELGGNYYVRLWSRSDQKHRYRSLRHRDKAKAMDYADRLAARLRNGAETVFSGRLTADRLFRLYLAHRTPQKARDSQKDDDRRIALWTNALGPNKDVSTISLGEWERFIDIRRSGAINARGVPLAEADRRPVSVRTVESNLRWLPHCFGGSAQPATMPGFGPFAFWSECFLPGHWAGSSTPMNRLRRQWRPW